MSDIWELFRSNFRKYVKLKSRNVQGKLTKHCERNMADQSNEAVTVSYSNMNEAEDEPLLNVQTRESPEGASIHSSYQEREVTGSPKVDIDILTQSGSHIVVKSENLGHADLSARTT